MTKQEKMIEIYERNLALAKEQLARQQDSFKEYVDKHLADSSFERNAIQDILIMEELKTKIEILENSLQLFKLGK